MGDLVRMRDYGNRSRSYGWHSHIRVNTQKGDKDALYLARRADNVLYPKIWIKDESGRVGTVRKAALKSQRRPGLEKKTKERRGSNIASIYNQISSVVAEVMKVAQTPFAFLKELRLIRIIENEDAGLARRKEAAARLKNNQKLLVRIALESGSDLARIFALREVGNEGKLEEIRVGNRLNSLVLHAVETKLRELRHKIKA